MISLSYQGKSGFAEPAERAAEGEADGKGEAQLTLQLLDAVGGNAAASQRSLARQLNVALGLTNAYLKRCIGRGLVKVARIPPNRYAYYLTPQGFSEKSRLTARYLANSFRFYRRARNQCDALLAQASEADWRRVAFAGQGELAEVALLCALQFEIEVPGIVDETATANRFRHVPLVRDLESLPGIDAVLLTDLKTPQESYERLAARLGAERVLTPALLKVNRAGNGAAP